MGNEEEGRVGLAELDGGGVALEALLEVSLWIAAFLVVREKKKRKKRRRLLVARKYCLV